MTRRKLVIVCMLLTLWVPACARRYRQEDVRVSGPDADAAEPAIATGRDGTTYVVWVEHHQGGGADVMITRVGQTGISNGPAVRVNPEGGEATAWRGDPPTVAVAPDGTVYVGWTARMQTNVHTSDLYVSTSTDNGKSFRAPTKVNDDQKPGAHGMHSMAIAADGRVYVSWLDERNNPSASTEQRTGAHKHMEANRELFVAFSRDGGKTFSPNRLIGRDACPCCKTSLAIAADGHIYASWRQVLPGDLRHIAVASSSDQGTTFTAPAIVSDDRWKLAGCPVSGPSLTTSSNGTLRVLWYSAGEAGPIGVYRSESHDGGRTFTPRSLVAEGLSLGTPVLLSRRDGSQAVWQSGLESSAHVMAAYLDNNSLGPAPITTQPNGQLPAASLMSDQILIACVRQTANDRRSVWLLRQSLL